MRGVATRPLGKGSSVGGKRRTVPVGMEQLAERARFLRAFLANPRRVGAVLPTSRRTVRAMLDMAPVGRARCVVELGAGTGAHTRELLQRLEPQGRLMAFEIDPALAAGLAEELRDPRLRVIADSAANLEAHLDGQRPDVIVSALPFTSLPDRARREILGVTRRVLSDDGVMLVLQYSPLMLRELRRTFGSVEQRLSPLNLPPAVVFACRPAARGAASAGERRWSWPRSAVSRRTVGEARRYVLAALLIELVLAPLGFLRGRLLFGVGLGCLVFFRDPPRPLRPERDTVYAPADGVVVGVDTVAEKWLPAGDALRVTTFLAVYDVHVNRSPAEGCITMAEEVPGGFAPAFLGRATANHRKRLAIDGDGRRVVLVQIAGMLARRISSWAWVGDRVTAGQRIGLIHFGSRAEVRVRAGEARALVEVGDRVRAGITPIARYARGAQPT